MPILRDDTLRDSPTDPRFLIQKLNWDGTPRNWTDQIIIDTPIWDLFFDEHGTHSNDIGCVTNFPGEGPMATVKCEKKEKTVKATTLDEVYKLAIAAYLELETVVEMEKASKELAELEAYEWHEDYDDWMDATFPQEIPKQETKETELPIEEILWDDLTPKQRKIFDKEWVADYMNETGCKKSVAKMQFEQWLNQEAQYARDENILHRRSNKKDDLVHPSIFGGDKLSEAEARAEADMTDEQIEDRWAGINYHSPYDY